MKKKKKKQRMIPTMVRLPREIWDKVKETAENEMSSASAVVRRAIIEWLRKGEKR